MNTCQALLEDCARDGNISNFNMFVNELKEKGNQCFYAKDYNGALKHYLVAIHNDPINGPVLCNLSYTFYKLKEFTKALETALSAIKADPTRDKAYVRAAKAGIALEHLDGAYKMVHVGLKNCPDSSVLKSQKKELEALMFAKYTSEEPMEYQAMFEDSFKSKKSRKRSKSRSAANNAAGSSEKETKQPTQQVDSQRNKQPQPRPVLELKQEEEMNTWEGLVGKSQAEKKKFYKSLCQEGYKEFLESSWMKSLDCYTKANDLILHFSITELRISEIQHIVLKYIICELWLRFCKYPDVVNVINMMKPVEQEYSNIFPAVHYILSVVYCKLNRFNRALTQVEKCLEFLDKDIHFEPQPYPETLDILPITEKLNLRKQMIEQRTICKMNKQPDAVCRYVLCTKNSNHVIPSTKIYYNDLDFSGFINVFCNSNCKINYHINCWKKEKKIYDKVTDKEMLNVKCCTDCCITVDNKPSSVERIDVIGPDGTVKSSCSVDKMKRKDSYREPSVTKDVGGKNKKESSVKKVPKQQSQATETNVEIEVDENKEMNKENKNINNNVQVPVFEGVFQQIQPKEVYILRNYYMFLHEQGPQSMEVLEEKWKSEKSKLQDEDLLKIDSITYLLLQTKQFRCIGKYIGVIEHFASQQAMSPLMLPVSSPMKKNTMNVEDSYISDLFANNFGKNVAYDLIDFDPYRPVKQPRNCVLDSVLNKQNVNHLLEDGVDNSCSSDLIDLDVVEDWTKPVVPLGPTDKLDEIKKPKLELKSQEVQTGELEFISYMKETPLWRQLNNQVLDETAVSAQLSDTVRDWENKYLRLKLEHDLMKVENEGLLNKLEQARQIKTEFAQEQGRVLQTYLIELKNMCDMTLSLHQTKCQDMVNVLIFGLPYTTNDTNPTWQNLTCVKEKWEAVKLAFVAEMCNFQAKLSTQISECTQKQVTLKQVLSAPRLPEYPFDPVRPLLESFGESNTKMSDILSQANPNNESFMKNLLKLRANSGFVSGLVPRPLQMLFAGGGNIVPPGLSQLQLIQPNNISPGFGNGPVLPQVQYEPRPSQIEIPQMSPSAKNTSSSVEPVVMKSLSGAVNQHSGGSLPELERTALSKTISNATNYVETVDGDDMFPIRVTETELHEEPRQNGADASPCYVGFGETARRKNAPTTTVASASDDKLNNSIEVVDFSFGDFDDVHDNTAVKESGFSLGLKAKAQKENKPKSIFEIDLGFGLDRLAGNQVGTSPKRKGKKAKNEKKDSTGQKIEPAVTEFIDRNKSSSCSSGTIPGLMSKSVNPRDVEEEAAWAADNSDFTIVGKKNKRNDKVDNMVNLNQFIPEPAKHKSTYDRLMGVLVKNFPSKSEPILAKCVLRVRRENGGTLNGMEMRTIMTKIKMCLNDKTDTMMVEKFPGSVWNVPGSVNNAWHKRQSLSECCICMEEFDENDKVELDCKHEFHDQCIRKWLVNDSVCPICRMFVRMRDEFPALG